MVRPRVALSSFALLAWCACTQASERPRRSPAPYAPAQAEPATHDPHDSDDAPIGAYDQVIGQVGIPLIGCPPVQPAEPEHTSMEVISWSVSRGYSREVVRRILLRHAHDVIACAEEHQGALDVSLSIDAAGAVTRARASSTESALRLVARCVTQRMRTWRFPATELSLPASIHARIALLPPRPRAESAQSCAPSLH